MSFGLNALLALAEAHFPDVDEKKETRSFIKPPEPQHALASLVHMLGSGLEGQDHVHASNVPIREYISIEDSQDEEAFKLWSLEHPKASSSRMFLGQEPFLSTFREDATSEPSLKKRKRSRKKKNAKSTVDASLINEEESLVDIPRVVAPENDITPHQHVHERVVFLDEPGQQDLSETEFDYEYEHAQSIARQNRAKMDAEDKERTWASIQKSKPFIPELNSKWIQSSSLPVGSFSRAIVDLLQVSPPLHEQDLEEGEEPEPSVTDTLLQKGLPVDDIPLSLYHSFLSHCLMKRTFVNQIQGWDAYKKQVNPFVPLLDTPSTRETIVWPVLPLDV